MKVIKIIIACLLTLSLSSCAEKHKEYAFYPDIKELKMPSGIYYKDHIYWEMKDKTNHVEGEKVGTLKSVAKENYFPEKEYSSTSDLKSYLGSDLYENHQTLYLKTKDTIHVFKYLTEMELSEEVKELDQEENEGMPAPHFVYQNMMYFNDYGPVEVLDYFKEVGEIKEVFLVAKQNFTGNGAVGDKLYATDFQNRFMLLKSVNSNNYYVYENGAYQE